MKNINLSLLVFLLACTLAYSQKRVLSRDITVTSSEELRLLNTFKEYQVVEIDLAKFSEDVTPLKETRILWDIGKSNNLDIQLYPHDIRSPSFKAAMVMEKGITNVEINKTVTYKGYLTNTGNKVRLTITDNFIYGSIQTDEGLLMIDQLKYVLKDKSIPSNKLVIYNNNNVKEGNLVCGTPDTEIEGRSAQEGVIAYSSSAGCNIVEVNVDCDTEYWNDYNDASFTRMLAEFNMIQDVYEDELDAILSVSTLHVFIGGVYVSSNPNTIINEAKSIWSSSPYSYELRDLVHHFTGKTTGIYGQASSIGATCNETTPVCFSEVSIEIYRLNYHITSFKSYS